ncbi:beta-carotene 15,15'-dioxygenase, Brp/Blh family [Mycolicibacterium lacusdiani]|uniref:beta-carotene 15,15'-dioxygenase, Brp/Blh family n=1 Tax=Mycolicibacterium lacusdiani TaxID=2895283 RepID=UPI001F45B7B6|nr:beta-carotene 15,15'-dioxygenase, Brp/Blh family [Mycolicibacterium lacusdiani]
MVGVHPQAGIAGVRPAADVAVTYAAVCSRWLVIGTVAVFGGQLFGAPSVTAVVALAVAVVGILAGVPHGAVDHLVAVRLSRGRSVLAVGAVYASVAAAAWALLRWTGPVALVAVVVLSALHFGLGELEVWRRLTTWRPGRPVVAALVVAGAGAVLLPVARAGDQFAEVAQAVSPGLAAVIGTAGVQIGLSTVWVGAAIVVTAAALRSGRGTVVVLDVALIGTLCLVAPPLVAFAVWFGGWHALRHSARLLAVDPGCSALLRAGRPRSAVMRLARHSALPSVAVIAVLAGLCSFTVAAPDPTAVLAEVLRVLLALTVPHMVVVWWLDRSQAG